MEVKKHIDGIWNTTEYEYRGHKIEMKSRENGGIKAHAWNLEGTKVEFTLRFNFINPATLLEKMKRKIDSKLYPAPLSNPVEPKQEKES
jgi:hypothetical protein